MKIPVKIKKRLADFSEYMLWRITERGILRTLRKKRYRKAVGSGWSKLEDGSRRYTSGNMDDYYRRNFGLEKETFKNELFFEEFGYVWYTKWLKEIHAKLRPAYHEHFIADLKNTLERLKTKDFVIETARNGKIYLKEDIERVRPILAWYYYPKIILEWEPIQSIFARLVLGFIGLIVFYLLGKEAVDVVSTIWGG